MKPEEAIQVACVDYLNAVGIVVHSIPNEGAWGNVARMMKLKRMGLKTGCADMLVWLPSGMTYIEVKDKYKKQTKSQSEFEGECHRYGIKYAIVRSLDDMIKLIGGENGRPEKAI